VTVDVERQTRETLQAAAKRLEAVSAPPEIVEAIRQLARQVGEPCVVAVVGRVKSGKSTFLNALLRDDKAVTGSTETTATINHFTHGEPDPQCPVRCHWRNGRVTEESEAFLAALQGNNIETLRRAEGINHLQYLMPNEVLKTVTLVDTPGTGAAVSEHERRTTEFLELEGRLRARHHEETREIQGSADAIVYLVGPVALTSDQDLLEAFVQTTGSEAHAVNALGVIAKIDLNDELIARRHELAAKVAAQLSDSLTAVLPVSAGLVRAVDRLHDSPGTAGLLIDRVRRLSGEDLELVLSDEELWAQYDYDGCPVPSTARRALRERVPSEWRVFATIARVAAESPDEEGLFESLEAIGGMPRLRQALREYFLERAHLLRCFRIAHDARRVLNRIRFEHLPAARRGASEDRARMARFHRFLDEAGGDPVVAAELREFVDGQLHSPAGASRLEDVWRDLDTDVGALLSSLGEHSADFAALQALAGANEEFSAEDLDELRALLGMYGSAAAARLRGNLSLEHCIQRQVAWRAAREGAPRGSARAAVAARAHDRLGILMEELEAPAALAT
jgi:Dynamin family